MAATITFVVCAAVAVGVDQIAKRMVVRRLGDGSVVRCAGVARLRLVRNPAGAFGLPRPRMFLLLALWPACAAAVIAHAVAAGDPQQFWLAAGSGVAVGGAAGNLIDMLKRGAVIDFIDVGWWPTFNLADAGILAGITIVIATWIR